MKLRASLAVAMLAAGALISAQQPTAPAPSPLVPNVPVRASLASGERPFFQFVVPANNAARITAEQDGIDIGLIARRPGSATPVHGLDFNGSRSGEERMFLPINDADVTWTIGVFAAWPNSRGQFVLSLEVEPATDHDRAIAAARQLHYDGSEINWLGDGVSYDKSLVMYEKAASDALAIGDVWQAAESTYQAARTRDVTGDTPGAIAMQLKALDLFRQAGRRDRESRVLNRLGDLSRKVGETVDSERYFQQALPLARDTEDIGTVADILNNSGLLLSFVGRTEEAIEQLESAIPLAQQLNSANVETALLNNLGDAYGRLGIFDRSLDYYRRAQVSVARLNLPRRTARGLFMMATTQFEMGDTEQAERTLKASLEVNEISGDRLGYAETMGFYGRMLHAAGDSDRAVEMFELALPVLRETKTRVGEARVLTSWAEVDLDRGNIDAAIDKSDQAINLYKLTNFPMGEQEARYVKAEALQRKGQIAEASNSIADAIRSVESMRGNIVRKELRTSYLATMRNYFDLQIELLQQQGRAAEAFEVSEHGRARTLLEGLAESAAKVSKGVDRNLVIERRNIQAQLNGKENYRVQLASQPNQGARVQATTAEIDNLLVRLRDVEANIKKVSPAYWALQRPEPVTTTEVQKALLDDQSVMIEYHVGAKRSFAWLVERGAVTAFELPPASTINDLARRYHEALSQEIDAMPAVAVAAGEKSANAIGRTLAAAIWDPIAPRVRNRRIVVVADAALQYVPFAALPSKNGEPLLAGNEIVYLPSASVLDPIRRESRPINANAKAAVFADPVFSRNDPRFAAEDKDETSSASRAADTGAYSRLRFSRREAEAIAASSPGTFQALDFSASKSTLASHDLRQYQILHFATHGTLNAQQPDLSGLVFSLFDRNGKPQDGFLRLHEIYNLDLNAGLVVLSACSTALGREVYGEGLIGLTRGFMYAGASRVVSSVWNVDDRASSLLMTRFYAAMLTRGLAPAAALREAQLSLLKDARWSNPHYWAAFSLQGDWK